MRNIVIILAFACIACTKPSNDIISESEYKDLLQQTILVLPDSSLTTEQIELKIKLCDLLFQYTDIENNCLKLSADKSKFEQEGIPNIYYNIIKYQLKETSIGIKMLLKEFPGKSLNIEEDLRDCKEQYWNTERPNLIKRIAL